MRGFKVCKGYNESEINIPKRSTEFSAGYDIESIEEILIFPNETVLLKTGLKAYMENDEVLKIYPRSSLGIKKHLMMANNVGIIDKDYFENEKNDGHIHIALYNFGKEPVKIEKYERVAQGIFVKYYVSESEQKPLTQRKGGIGSTNKH